VLTYFFSAILIVALGVRKPSAALKSLSFMLSVLSTDDLLFCWLPTRTS
jgi:hypothetical protein